MKNLFLLLLLFISIALGCEKEPPKVPEAQTVSVSAVPVEAVDVPDTVQTVGTVESKHEAELSAKVMGSVVDIQAEEGRKVSKGDVLLTIDASDIKAKKNEAVQAKAEGTAGLKEARAALENVKINMGRIQNLYDDHAVTKKELDDMTTQQRMAEAKVEQVEARIAQADAAIAESDVLLGYAVIRSPVSGVVTAKMVSRGEMAAPGRPLVKVMDDSALRLVTTVKESDVSGIRKGDAVKVTVDALGGREVGGKVSDVIPAADPATRSFAVKVDLPSVQGLMPGMFGRAYLPVGKRKAVLLPDGALLDKEGMKGVYVITPEGVLRFQAVRVGSVVEGRQEALSGLSGGEKVVVGDTASLREGMRTVVK